MVDKMKYAALIPARGGSKSIPLKNIKELCGRPLLYWTIDAAIQCKYIDKVYVSTDSEIIKETTMNHPGYGDKLVCINRDPSTATDQASTESVMLDFAQKYDFENILLIQATSPLLGGDDLNKGIERFEEMDCDSLLSVVKQKRFIWSTSEDTAKPVNYDFRNRPRRQEFDGYFVENGAFYITGKDMLLDSKCRLSGRIGLYEMSEENYFEIDEPEDWLIIEGLLKKRLKKCIPTEIKVFLTDCDGVLTDAGMYYSEKGDELKKFNTRDGMGLAKLRACGIKTGIITSEDTEIVSARAKKLKMDYVYQGVKEKLTVLKEISDKENIPIESIAYIGDDINDIDCVKAAGLGITVADALDEVKEAADFITRKKGGEGAVREAADYIINNMNRQ